MYQSPQELKHETPLFLCPVPAGFPSPADDYREKSLDLNEHLIKHPAATVFVRANDDSMIGGGIFCGDLLIVDRSLKPIDKKVVIASCDGSIIIRRFRKIKNRAYLIPENKDYKTTEIIDGMNIEILGVATTVIHPV